MVGARVRGDAMHTALFPSIMGETGMRDVRNEVFRRNSSRRNHQFSGNRVFILPLRG